MRTMGHVLAVAASVLWGLTYCLDERVLAGMSVFRLYLLHCLCGALFAAVILLALGEPPGSLLRFGGGERPLLAATLVTASAAALCILGSIQLLGAGKSAVLEISYPLFVAFFSTAFFGGHLSWPVAVGGGFMFVGALIIVLAD